MKTLNNRIPYFCRRSFCRLLLTMLLFAPLAAPHAAEPILTPAALWKDYDPNQGEFKEEVVKQETRDSIFNRDSYISAYVLGEEIRVYCRYSVKTGAAKAPGLLVVHGWMGAAEPDRKFVDDGWAVMAHDYCGQTAGRPNFTKYPEKLRHGNMDRTVAGPVRAQDLEGKPITDPKQTSDYVWYAIQRRVLSYLEQQKEVDRTRLGATGYSYGGTLMWNLATDPRVKAVAAYFGIGYNDYYRDKQVWLYNVPYIEPPKSSGEEIILASIAPEAHVPFITAATLFLNGSNDHHGGHERGLESFKKFPKDVPWSFAIQARGHHDTEKIGHNTKFWLEKQVLGKEVVWPEHPKSEIRLDAEGVPELVITPASPDAVRKVEMFYALKNPSSFARSWRDTPGVRQGGSGSARCRCSMWTTMSSATPTSPTTRRSSARPTSTRRSLPSSATRWPPTNHRTTFPTVVTEHGATSPSSKAPRASRDFVRRTTDVVPAPSNCTIPNGRPRPTRG